MKPIYTLVLVSLFFFSSCGLFVRTVVGVNPYAEWRTEAQLQDDVEEFGLSNTPFYYMDTVMYVEQLKAYYEPLLHDADSTALDRIKRDKKDDIQPLQLRYFDGAGQPLFKIMNCYAKIVPINWDVAHCFDQFPPNTLSYLEGTKHHKLDFFLPGIIDEDGAALSMDALPKADYYVLVTWNSFMNRPARKLIQQVKDYHTTHQDRNIHTIYVNNHNMFLWNMLNAEERRKTLNKDED